MTFVMKYMKRIFALLCLAVLLCGCKEKPEPGPDPSAWEDTFNGQLVTKLASAYDYWVTNNSISPTIRWEGVEVHVSEYARAAIALVLKMVDEPETWMDKDIAYPSATFSLTSDNPFLPDEVPFTAFVQLLRNQYRSMTEDKAVMLNMTIPGYEPNLSTTGLVVMLYRAMAAYTQDNSFPQTIGTWEASYTHATTNCDISSPVVKNARDAAWTKAGVTEASTVRQKADAIFRYARDEFDYQYYSDTEKGAVGTITAKAGNCCDLSHSVVAMARLSGIPARYFHAQCQYSDGEYGHVVSQLFIDGEWVMADASNNSNSLGSVRFTSYWGLHYYESLPF